MLLSAAFALAILSPVSAYRSPDNNVNGTFTPKKHRGKKKVGTPMNFRTVKIEDGTDSCSLDHQITWDSSTGNMADLSTVITRENINYGASSHPDPFAWGGSPPANHFYKKASPRANTGGGTDHHGYGSGLGMSAAIKSWFKDPLVQGILIADQIYEYNANPDAGESDSGWTAIPGDSKWTITRRVFQKNQATWTYCISKISKASENPVKHERCVPIKMDM